jgi:hypothetical protein
MSPRRCSYKPYAYEGLVAPSGQNKLAQAQMSPRRRIDKPYAYVCLAAQLRQLSELRVCKCNLGRSKQSQQKHAFACRSRGALLTRRCGR